MDLNFFNIREHDGSKNSGFEELVCQLANLESPENGKRFVKKEGAGGDAGVECYWVLDDDAEVCWQAKYFPTGMDSSRWSQIDESFSTALKKHENLEHYIVCLPLDKSDSRKIGRGGKQVVTVEDEWLEHVEKWKGQAKEVGRDVQFSYWGKHEITLRLSIDNPLYSGRALYWFNSPILGRQQYTELARRSKDSIGDRYTPEFHIELPIARSFDGLCLNDEWWSHLREKRSQLSEAIKDVVDFLGDSHEAEIVLPDSEALKTMNDQFSELMKEVGEGVRERNFHSKLDYIKSYFSGVEARFKNIYSEIREKNDLYSREDRSAEKLYKLINQLEDFGYFLSGRNVSSSIAKAMLLYGEAGIGKSHLLCDLSLNRIDSGLPTIFILGSQYCGGDPCEFVRESLDLTSFRNADVFGAIDAAGEASGERVLIVIDAINEGSYRDEWHDHIRGFISYLSAFEHIAVVFSCRSTYLNYMIPDSADESCLPRIHHMGFQGYEHRAAEKFLSKQGISKPSAPILAPEFSNPLFLKTCCHALKDRGETSFPKGLNSITSLFDFYIGSIESRIAKKKRYNPRENVVRRSLEGISSSLFPENLDGVCKSDARSIVSQYDPNPNVGESLFDILLDEGVIAEDISYRKETRGELVIRYTYERFSDYFIAESLLNSVKDIRDEFRDGGEIYTFINEHGYYSIAGIFEALSIFIAEKYAVEIQDLIPEELDISKWQLDETFQNSVIWRSPASFSDRTLEILNGLDGYQFNNPALDIFLKLSTEPNHPWNAELLHRNLVSKKIAERDGFWSVYVAHGDSSEEHDEHESIIRTIIEWSTLGDISAVEQERVRLCLLTLSWFLTTSNRRIRDRSTKAISRLLSVYPCLINDLLVRFFNVNDVYLVERLMAACYGAILNVDDKSIINEVSGTVYDFLFKEEKPLPHILLRDYGRGILEYALYVSAIPESLTVENFRPPYQSQGDLEKPTDDEIKNIPGDEFSSRIKSSLMGFPGDFGNYTMGCVHNWSSTPISSDEMETGIQIKERFVEGFLTGDVQKEYQKKISEAKSRTSAMDAESLKRAIERIELGSEEYRLSFEEERKKGEEFKERVNSQLDSEQQEYFRWMSGLADDRPAAFSRKWAQRWVCKRAHDFGWKEDLFSDFERGCAYGRGEGLGPGAMERVGKKYQWMAFHELLARLSDNYRWIDRGYSDVDDASYEGPWQACGRDIDPSIWARRCGEYKTYHNKHTTWWQPYSFPFPKDNSLKAKCDFLWDESSIPCFVDLLQLENPSDNKSWSVMHGFWSENQKYIDEDSESPYLDGWFRLNAIFIPKGDFQKLSRGIGNSNLCDPHIVNGPSTGHEGFLGEYPWHTIYDHVSGWREPESGFREQIKVKHLVPFSKYEWEEGSKDYSLESSLYFMMPSKELVESMGLKKVPGKWGEWRKGNDLAFLDPCLEEYGPSYGLLRTDFLKNWLDENNMEIAWLIGGEKQLFSSGASHFYGRLVFSGLFRLEDDKPYGSMWFKREEPRE